MSFEDSGFAAPPPPPPAAKDENMWAMLCHLSALAGLMVPLGNIIGPLVVWLVKKDEMPRVDDQGKEALNFQISLTIYTFVAAAIAGMLIVVVIGIVLLPIVVIGMPIFGIVMTVIASLQANQGVDYRYPLCIRFIS